MPFNGSGTFTRLMNWSNDALAGIKIKSDRHDQEDDNFASGLTNCVTKDGQTQPTADIPMNGKKLTNLGAPINDTDASTKAYADLPKPSTTGLTISGADANGRLTFSSPTGVNGLSFTGADLSWLARLAAAPTADYPNRLVLNDKPDGTGTDQVSISDAGFFSFNSNSNIISNGYYKSSAPAAWKATNAGWLLLLQGAASDGAYRFYGSTASLAADASATLNQNFIINANGTASSRAGFTAGGRVQGTDVLSQGIVYAANGSVYLSTNGNVVGAVWSNWGAGDAYSAISARIEARATAWANDRVANLQYRKTSQGSMATTSQAAHICPSGAVLTGTHGGSNNTIVATYYHYLQVYDPVRGWVGFSG